MAQAAGLKLHSTVKPKKAELRALERGLTSYNRQRLGSGAKAFYVFANDKRRTVGGVACSVRQDTLLIKSLWVDESVRGHGYGRRLVAECEKQALAEGCGKVVVDTMTYQAPDFYRKLGYQEKGVISDYYNGFDRVFFEKRLQA